MSTVLHIQQAYPQHVTTYNTGNQEGYHLQMDESAPICTTRNISSRSSSPPWLYYMKATLLSAVYWTRQICQDQWNSLFKVQETNLAWCDPTLGTHALYLFHATTIYSYFLLTLYCRCITLHTQHIQIGLQKHVNTKHITKIPTYL